MKRLIPACCALLLGLGGGLAGADDAPALWLDGVPVKLESGLGRTADGRTWIALDDLRGALGVVVKRLIPRPPEGRWRQRHRERDSWILCGPHRCATYRGETLGAESQPTFDAAGVARLLGYRLRARAGRVELSSPRAPKRPRWRASIGMQVGDLALPCLDGRTRRIGEYRGRRLLIVTWSSWSPVRERLDEWRTAWPQRTDKKLDLWFVAVDVEGERHVRDHVNVGFDAPVGIDRNADLTRRLRFNDVGHWFLIDEVGILRAESERFGEAERRWIALHFDEPLLTAARVPAPPAPDLAALRRQVAATPRDATKGLALAEALERVAPAEARAQVAALLVVKPQSTAFAFRLTRLYLDAGDVSGALRILDEARRRMPNTWLLRKQFWALEEPGRFHNGPIDLDWQKKKRKEEAWLRKR